MKSIVFGNILDAKGIIVHGCNNRGVMGSGAALAIRNKWPKAYQSYYDTVDKWDHSGDALLGHVDLCIIDVQTVIANAITQDGFGKDGKKYVSYKAIARAFETIVSAAVISDLTVNYPLIGAGLGGGDWAIISEIIDEAFRKAPEVHRTLWILE